MGRVNDVLTLLFLSCLWRLSSGQQNGGCRNFDLQFERVFSIPGEVSMLHSSLLSLSVVNQSEPYNVTWYRLGSDRPISSRSGRVLVLEETLWLLNVSLADAGDYVTVVRTPGQCFRQETKLVVAPPLSRPQCGRPWTAGQRLFKGVTDHLSCPLKDHISKLQSYGVSWNISWFKNCSEISDGSSRFSRSSRPSRFSYWGSSLKVERVESSDDGLYTCVLHFSLDGTEVSVSETIEAEVQGDYYQLPQIYEPAKDVVKAELGSTVSRRCLVFVPCEGRPLLDIDVYWEDEENHISDDLQERIHMTEERREWTDRGLLINRSLVISELTEQDLNLNYTCQVLSGRGFPSGYFTLLHKDPELLIPVLLLIFSCLLLFLLGVAVFHFFKLELVLWFRSRFSIYYTSASDALLYDAYLVYPQSCSPGWSEEVERFALHTLPQVLEEACGFSLFIPDRDSLPGQAVMDSVEENLRNSRRLILLYTASTFNYKHCSNNNNTLLSRPWDQADTQNHSLTIEESLNTTEENFHTSKKILNTTKENLNITTEKLSTNNEDLSLSKGHLNISKEQLSTSQDPLTSRTVSFSPSVPQRCDHRCDHARSLLECVEAMHRALLERSLKVILVELEELSSSDLQQLPDSVRHLRQSQGAVCWRRRSPGTRWRTGTCLGTGTCWRTGRMEAETQPSSCLSPHCRFWKEVRYRMPVRTQRRSRAEDVELLKLHWTQTRTEELNLEPV